MSDNREKALAAFEEMALTCGPRSGRTWHVKAVTYALLDVADAIRQVACSCRRTSRDACPIHGRNVP